jgi:hypothetical protein
MFKSKQSKITVPVHALKTYIGSTRIAPLTFSLDAVGMWVISIMPRPPYPWERTPVPTEQENGWSPDPAWIVMEKTQTLASAGIRTAAGPSRS